MKRRGFNIYETKFQFHRQQKYMELPAGYIEWDKWLEVKSEPALFILRLRTVTCVNTSTFFKNND